MTEEPTRPGSSPLSAELEAEVFQLFFATQEVARADALTDFAQRHPEHEAAIGALVAKLQAGEGVFSELGSADAADLPTDLGGYKILDKLGEGGFGVVYLAEQEQPIRRRVAVKCLLPGMDSRRVLARFEAERQALAMMSHPGIAQVYDARSDGAGRPFFVMEYVPGEAITDYCDRQRLTTRQRLQLFTKVCDAVQHAHQKGIIHRDLKPSNVLVTEVDDKAVPKIIDFGVAKAIYQPLTMMTVFTEVGRMVGTPAYMSPEQTSPTPLDVDTRTDIYSLGVLLYEILAGSLPFTPAELREQGMAAIHKVIVELTPPRPSSRITSSGSSADLAARRHTEPTTLAKDLKGDLDWIVLRAMEKDRTRRYDTAQALAADIERHLNFQPVSARPPQWSYLVGRFVRRHRTQVVAGAVVLLALVAGLVSSTVFYVEAQENLERYNRLSDHVLLAECIREANTELWPEHPDRAPAMQTWLAKAQPLASRLELHQRSLADLDRIKAAADRDHQEQFLYQTLSDLVDKLKAFADPERGLLQSVTARLRWASTIRKRSIEDHQAKWGECHAAIKADPRFGGLDLAPQLGLVPLGPDPVTGLWEFAELRTGKAAFRQHDGPLVFTESEGMVFVLVPGGEFQMGAQRTDPAGANYVREATPLEKPVHEVSLAPFFISKFEMTQGQWRRFTGRNPSRFPPAKLPNGDSITELHPIESVSWLNAELILARLGLALPTEAQWEYACRAGTQTAWSTGDTVESLKGKVNLLDEGSAAFYPGVGVQRGFRDGYPLHAPVERMAANGFGLYHMMGNVSEWTRDRFKFYENPTDPVDGARLGDKGARPGVISRGGNFGAPASYCRSAIRSAHKPDQISHEIGLRPVRRIEK